ncbi:MAG: hypothetical protein ACHQ50_11640 [Fimbriimonadales bacterium]
MSSTTRLAIWRPDCYQILGARYESGVKLKTNGDPGLRDNEVGVRVWDALPNERLYITVGTKAEQNEANDQIGRSQ